MQLAGFRQRYPQYNHLSDAQLMDAFYKKLYSDLTREEFDKRMAAAKSGIDPENLAQLKRLSPILGCRTLGQPLGRGQASHSAFRSWC